MLRMRAAVDAPSGGSLDEVSLSALLDVLVARSGDTLGAVDLWSTKISGSPALIDHPDLATLATPARPAGSARRPGSPGS